jgi:mono/diheme cytochrome c family protein
MLLAASTQRTLGLVILAIVFLGGIAYIFFNIRSAKAEVGSEIELAANRSPALLDEDLEGRRLDLALMANLVMLTIIAVALPFYWLGEPGREEGLNVDTARIFTNRGESIYTEGAQCVNCHGAGGVGGSVTTSLTDDDGGFIAQVVWRAPALNTVMSRFSDDEILHTLNFGRNGVMPAWGAGGGGPLTDQQLEEVMFYLRSIALDGDTMAEQVESGLVTQAEDYVINGTDDAGDYVFTGAHVDAIRDADTDQLEATLAVEGPDVDCDDYLGVPAEDANEATIADRSEFEAGADAEALEELALCDTLGTAAAAVSAAFLAGGDQVSADAAEWLAEAQATADTATMMALDENPSLGGEGQEEALRWAALTMLSDEESTVPNVENYRIYGSFLFNNPAAAGTYSCARCHTYGFSFGAAERFTVRANGTTKSVLPDGYVDGGGFFGKRLTGESTRDQFFTVRTHAQFIENGQAIGQPFGRGGSGGNGQMPGWAARSESAAVGPGIANDAEAPYDAQLNSDQIDAIVAFERNL